MNFTYTPWLCHTYDYKHGTQGCSRKYEGYGSDSTHTEDYNQRLKCEECGGEDWFLLRYRVPEKDIRFFHDRIEVNGVRVMRKPESSGYTSPHKLEYISALKPECQSFEEAKKNGYNVHTEHDWWINFGAWADTIHYEISDELVPDDIFEAFKIFTNNPNIRRAIYKSDYVDCDENDPDALSWTRPYFKKFTNGRVEYY